MASLNKVILIGNAGKDPQVRYVGDTSKVARFSLCTTEYYTKNGERQGRSEWHEVSVWGKAADVVEKYVRKGSQLYVEGSIRTSAYTDKDGVERRMTEIAAQNIQLLGSRPQDDGRQAPREQPSGSGLPDRTGGPQPARAADQLNPVNFTDDLPF